MMLEFKLVVLYEEFLSFFFLFFLNYGQPSMWSKRSHINVGNKICPVIPFILGLSSYKNKFYMILSFDICVD